MHPHNNEAPELEWAAFRYTCGELDEAEALAFEDLLATDQQAREALAAAVGLAQAVRRAEGAVVPMPTSRLRSRRALFAAAASVLVATGLALWSRTAPPSLGHRDASSAEAHAVALAWLDLHTDPDPEDAAPALGEFEDAEAPIETAEAAEDSIPAWLFEATEAYSGQGGV